MRLKVLASVLVSEPLSTHLLAPHLTIHPMRASQPYFPSISLVLSQAERPIHLPNHLPKLLSQQQVAFFPVSHEDYMVRLR